MKTLGFLSRIKTWITSCCRPNKDIYRNSCTVLRLNHSEDFIQWKAIIPQNTILLEHVEHENRFGYCEKYKVWYVGDEYVKPSKEECMRLLNTKVNVPWVYIGGEDSEGHIIDVTTEISSYLISGNIIKLELLRFIEPSIVRWRYMDFSTLEEADFPVEGIQIKE